MKPISSCKTLLLTFALAATGWAQTAKPVYYTTTFFHVDTSKRAEYLNLQRTVGAKYYTAMVKELPEVLSYNISEVIFPGNPEPAWNFIAVQVSTTPPPSNAATLDTIFKTATGLDRAGQSVKIESIRTRVGQTLSVRVASEGTEPLKEGDVMSVDYIKIADGRASDYFAGEAADWQPLHLQNIKDGVMKRHLLTRVRVPGGDRMYDAQSSHIYASLEAYLAPRASYEQLMRKVSPEKSYSAVWTRTSATRHIVRTELRRVIFAASK